MKDNLKVHIVLYVFIAAVLALGEWVVAQRKGGMPVVPVATRASGLPLIQVQPFAGIPAQTVKQVFQDIRKCYSNTILLSAVPLPARAWYKPRGRYRADSLISWLSHRTPNGATTIGITSYDISTTKDKVPDWGVMGLGYQPGNSCVASTFRLKKAKLRDQLFKIAIHELGHTQGLPHCSNKTCYMADAEGGNPTDQETGFCSHCRRLLEQNGWVFDAVTSTGGVPTNVPQALVASVK
jgi:archaemetzincin